MQENGTMGEIEIIMITQDQVETALTMFLKFFILVARKKIKIGGPNLFGLIALLIIGTVLLLNKE